MEKKLDAKLVGKIVAIVAAVAGAIFGVSQIGEFNKGYCEPVQIAAPAASPVPTK